MRKATKIMPNTTASSEKPKLRVAAYCRVSNDTDGQLESLKTQIRHYEAFIRTRNGNTQAFITTRVFRARKRKSDMSFFG